MKTVLAVLFLMLLAGSVQAAEAKKFPLAISGRLEEEWTKLDFIDNHSKDPVTYEAGVKATIDAKYRWLTNVYITGRASQALEQDVRSFAVGLEVKLY